MARITTWKILLRCSLVAKVRDQSKEGYNLVLLFPLCSISWDIKLTPNIILRTSLWCSHKSRFLSYNFWFESNKTFLLPPLFDMNNKYDKWRPQNKRRVVQMFSQTMSYIDISISRPFLYDHFNMTHNLWLLPITFVETKIKEVINQN